VNYEPTPCVAGNLMAGVICGLQRTSLIIDTTVQGTGHKEGSFGTRGIELLDQASFIVVRSVVKCEGDLVRRIAPCDNGTCSRTSTALK